MLGTSLLGIFARQILQYRLSVADDNKQINIVITLLLVRDNLQHQQMISNFYIWDFWENNRNIPQKIKQELLQLENNVIILINIY